MSKHQFFRIEAKHDAADVYVLDQIVTESTRKWLDIGVSAQQIADQLNKVSGYSRINVHVNSPGGDVYEGATIYNLLRSFKGSVHTYVHGLAASMGSIIALAGERVHMAPNAQLMIHSPSTYAGGTARDLREMADLLDKVEDSLIEVYTAKTKLPADQLKAMMQAGVGNNGTWLNARQALDMGFIDKITGPTSVENLFLPPPPPKDEEPMKFLMVLQALSLAEGVSEADVIAAIDKRQKEAVDKAVAAVKAEQDQLVAKVKADQLVAVGRAFNLIPKGTEEAVLAAAQSNPEAAMKLLQVPTAIRFNDILNRAKENGEDRSKWGYDEWAKNDFAGLQAMKRDQPEEYKKLVASYQPTKR